MSQPFVGQIMLFAGNFAPRGWMLCNGQLLSISQYAALFSILGTNFGGNGVSTFGLPNLQGRAPIHWGNGAGLTPYVLGESTGSQQVTILYNNMPQHNHLINASSAVGTAQSPSNAYLAGSQVPPPRGGNATAVDSYVPSSPNVTLNQGSVSVAGGNVPINIVPPILAVTFCIAVVGIFPTRN